MRPQGVPMKNLYLIRHAKSSWAHDGLADHERPLNARGHKQLDLMRKAIRAEGAFEGTIYCSSAVRARQTAEGLVPADILPSVHIDDNLYTFDGRTLINWLRNRQDDTPITLIGHNPALAELADYLLEMPPVCFPTCAFMHIALPIKHWRELARDTGQLQTFLPPKALLQLLGES